jgi:hypothetical protein
MLLVFGSCSIKAFSSHEHFFDKTILIPPFRLLNWREQKRSIHKTDQFFLFDYQNIALVAIDFF